jgi:hypothetical protein
MKASDKPVATWPMRLEEWMKSQGILKNDASGAAN